MTCLFAKQPCIIDRCAGAMPGGAVFAEFKHVF